ncbi:hypothetical protein EDC01DRAFT_630660 [Geopyxis carbonaria]|nr:hypothetical protein EDC01DRAFT_630660 [Geopyxis carbonaria]
MPIKRKYSEHADHDDVTYGMGTPEMFHDLQRREANESLSRRAEIHKAFLNMQKAVLTPIPGISESVKTVLQKPMPSVAKPEMFWPIIEDTLETCTTENQWSDEHSSESTSVRENDNEQVLPEEVHERMKCVLQDNEGTVCLVEPRWHMDDDASTQLGETSNEAHQTESITSSDAEQSTTVEYLSNQTWHDNENLASASSEGNYGYRRVAAVSRQYEEPHNQLSLQNSLPDTAPQVHLTQSSSIPNLEMPLSYPQRYTAEHEVSPSIEQNDHTCQRIDQQNDGGQDQYTDLYRTCSVLWCTYENCGQRFDQPEVYEEHMSIHERCGDQLILLVEEIGGKPGRCPSCPVWFQDTYSLQRHWEILHPTLNRYMCYGAAQVITEYSSEVENDPWYLGIVSVLSEPTMSDSPLEPSGGYQNTDTTHTTNDSPFVVDLTIE